MTMSPDGKYLFTSTAGDDSVAMFAINPDDGTLTKEFALPISGEYPKDIALFPDGKRRERRRTVRLPARLSADGLP